MGDTWFLAGIVAWLWPMPAHGYGDRRHQVGPNYWLRIVALAGG